MSSRLTEEELKSFKHYAEENMTETDGTLCQWADYTVRLINEVRMLRVLARKDKKREFKEI